MSEETPVTKTQVRQGLEGQLTNFYIRLNQVKLSVNSIVIDDQEMLDFHEWINIMTGDENTRMKQREIASDELRAGLVEHVANVEASLSTLERDIEGLAGFWHEQY